MSASEVAVSPVGWSVERESSSFRGQLPFLRHRDLSHRIDKTKPKADIQDISTSLADQVGVNLHERLFPLHHHLQAACAMVGIRGGHVVCPAACGSDPHHPPTPNPQPTTPNPTRILE